MQIWKILGLAGVVGATVAVAAAGARAAQERQRREFRDADADELRRRLHARLAAADAADLGSA